jgi:hypothetical protein
MPRPKFKPTEEQRRMVKSMAAYGIPQEAIAREVGIRSQKTLRLHFRDELNRGEMEANYSVAQALHKKAKAGDTTAQIFWMRARAGWKDRPTFVSGTGAAPPFIVAREDGDPQS